MGLLIVSPFLIFSAQASETVTTQLGLVVDGSSSISSSEFAIIREGIAEAVRNASQMPHDGTVELTVVQFGGWSWDHVRARVEVYPTVITATNYASVANIIENMNQMGGYTPLADGLLLCWSQISGSSNFPIATKQVLNVATNGEANVALKATPPPSWVALLGSPPGSGNGDATWVRNGAVSEGLDELDAEGIDTTTSNINWMRDYLVYPQPGTIAPPYTAGWVKSCADFEEFAVAVGEKFRIVTQQYTLTVNIDGNGSVSKNPDQATYSYGTVVTLTATADPGWTFSSWSGDASGTNPVTTVNMTSNKVVNATFTQDQYTLTINIDGNGDVSKSPDQATYSYGTVVNLTAVPDAGWSFSSWSGDLTGSTNPDSITMDSNKTVTAHFQVENTPPEASNLSINPSSPYTTDNLVGSYTYYDADSDPESGSEIRWYKDSILQSAYNDLLTVPSSATAKGQVWYFTVRPKDGMDFGDLQTSSTVVIGNSPPTAPVVDVTPDSPVTTDDLVCTVVTSSTDPDGDTVTYTYEWYKNGILQPAETTVTTALSDTVSSTLTAKGQVWKCIVTPNDGMVNGTSDEDQVTIGNTPPEASNLAISPSSPYTTDDLVGSYTYYDADGDPESGSEIRWYKDGLLQSAFNDQLTVPSSATAKGQVWYFTVKPKDGTDFGALQTSPSVTIQNSPPTAPVVDVTPDLPFTTDDLTCTVVVPSTDPDGDTVTYTYEWYKDDILQPGLTTTTTALSVIIDSSYTHKGEVWKCVVTPHGSDGPPDDDQVTILNSPPSIDGVNITPDPAYTDDTLTATPYGWSDADADPEGYAYQWQKWNGVSWQNISGETSSTLSSDNFVKGDQIKVICTPFDGEDYGTPKEDTITISNSPPSAPVVDVTPNSPVTTDDLTCTVTSSSTDPDGDTVTYTYEWYKDDILQPGLTTVTTALSVTIDSSNTAEGEVWRCVVTPNDGTEDGPTDQDEVTIGTIPNSPPVLNMIGNKMVDEETLLSFTATASDPDVPPQTLTFSLGPGAPPGASITSGGAFTWTPTEAQGPGVYDINITVSDGIDIDYEVIQVTVNEVNLPPVLNHIGAKTVDEGSLLQFTVTASDPDIPAQTLIYSASNLPPGATFNPSTRVFSWTPTSGQAGTYLGVHFEVSDGYLTDSEDITITVTAPPPPPPPPPVGGCAVPITLDLGTSNSLIPQIGLASILSAIVAATIILVKRRKKTSKREH